jgi:hypothetical protein
MVYDWPWGVLFNQGRAIMVLINKDEIEQD